MDRGANHGWLGSGTHTVFIKKKKGSKRGWRRKEEKGKGRRGEAKEGNRQEGQKGETENLV